jgi:hypothetical protein
VVKTIRKIKHQVIAKRRRSFSEAVVESLTLRAINRFGVPLFTGTLVVIGYLAWQYFDVKVLTAIDAYQTTNEQKLDEIRRDVQAGHERGIAAGQKLAETLDKVQSTLADVQRAAAAQQATATAQYQELKGADGVHERRLERLEDRLNNGGPR